jgi:hypothetical protein
LARNTAEDASAILSPKRYFVNVVGCSSGLPRQKENAKKKCIVRRKGRGKGN